jgi:tetratricopeptide (TPR) repeat protein
MILTEKGFKPIRLGKEIISDEDYLAKISELIPKCLLALVILDGLRPNVLFEFGYLKALDKSIIILKSSKGLISIKTLYKHPSDSGLQSKQFQNKLREPKIDTNYHISDFAGKHVQSFNIDNEKDEDDSLEKVLLQEINARKEKLKNDLIKATTDQTRSSLQEIMQHIIPIVEFGTGLSNISCDKVIGNINKLVDTMKEKQYELPISVYKYIGFSYLQCALEKKENQFEYANLISLAIGIYQNGIDASSPIKDYNEIPSLHYYKGICHRYESQIGNAKEKLELSIDDFNSAADKYKEIGDTFDYSISMNNLGLVNNDLYNITGDKNYLIRAQNNYKEALKFFSKTKYPLQYSVIQFNLGNILYLKSLYEFKSEPSISAFKYTSNEALTSYREAIDNSLDYKIIKVPSHLNSGAIYYNLQLVDKSQNSNWMPAINESKRVLEILDSDKENILFGNANYNLGVIYNYLYLTKREKEYNANSIRHFENALKNYQHNNLREYIIETLNYLGSVYLPNHKLEAKEYNLDDCEKAQKALTDALDLTITSEQYKRIELHYYLGIIYEAIFLLGLENKDKAKSNALENYQQVINYYENNTSIRDEFISKIYTSSLETISKLNQGNSSKDKEY